MTTRVAVDVSTEAIRVGLVDPKGSVRILLDGQNQPATPAVVARRDDLWLAGHAALGLYTARPDAVAWDPVSAMVAEAPLELAGIALPAEDGVRALLAQCFEDCRRRIGEDIDDAVLVLPSAIPSSGQARFRATAIAAGWPVSRVLPRCIAALGAVARALGDLEGRAMQILDWGEPTAGACVVAVRSRSIGQVGSWCGDDARAANLVDAVVTFGLRRVREELGVDGADQPRFLAKLRLEAMRAVRDLELGGSACLVVIGGLRGSDGDVLDVEVEIGRSDYEPLATPVLEAAVRTVQHARGTFLPNGAGSSLPLITLGSAALDPLFCRLLKQHGLVAPDLEGGPLEAAAIGAARVAYVWEAEVRDPWPAFAEPSATSGESVPATPETSAVPDCDATPIQVQAMDHGPTAVLTADGTPDDADQSFESFDSGLIDLSDEPDSNGPVAPPEPSAPATDAAAGPADFGSAEGCPEIVPDACSAPIEECVHAAGGESSGSASADVPVLPEPTGGSKPAAAEQDGPSPEGSNASGPDEELLDFELRGSEPVIDIGAAPPPSAQSQGGIRSAEEDPAQHQPPDPLPAEAPPTPHQACSAPSPSAPPDAAPSPEAPPDPQCADAPAAAVEDPHPPPVESAFGTDEGVDHEPFAPDESRAGKEPQQPAATFAHEPSDRSEQEGPRHEAPSNTAASERPRAGAEPPAELGPYRNLRLLTADGNCSVFAARDRAGRRVHLRTYAVTSSAAERAYQRARRAVDLSHPYLARIVDDREQGDVFLLAALWTGGTLREAIGPLGRGSAMPVRSVLEIGIGIVEALRFVHGRRILHRNIKPENLLVDPSGRRVALTGFEVSTELTNGHVAQGRVGTLLYMAPEVFQGGASPASDVYSAAVVLYEAMTGRVPFFARDARELGAKVLNEAPTPPSELNPAIPQRLDAIILRGLHKRPLERALAVDDLRRILGRGPDVRA